ncbi:hypothetical protein KJ641_02340 [Patescibacteria group bacterium]|nr:hypothetical protein [Patescibacteria group bacterium]MBU1895684.1 hypothetical protein [Patescibacteria group bacterium]
MVLFKKKVQITPELQPAQIKKITAESYTPVGEDLSYKEFKFANWVVSNRLLMKKIGIGIIIGWCVISLGYSGFRWAEYLIVGYWGDRDMTNQIASEIENYNAIQSLYSAQNLVLGRTQVFDAENNKYDFFTEVKNSNKNWLAVLEYKYSYGGGETEMREVTILPQTELPVVILGYENSSFPSSAKLVIENIRWHRIDPHMISDVPAFMAERIVFVIDDFNFVRGATSGLSTNRVAFDIINSSAYSYWQPEFSLVMLNGGSVVGVANITVDQFRTGDTHSVDLRLFDTSINVTDIMVIPMVNVFDESAFMSPGE